MPITPTIHTFDPQIAGKIGLYIDPPGSADMVLWLASKTQGGSKTQVGITYVNTTIGLDGLSFIVDGPSAVTYWKAKLHDPNGYGSPSEEIAAIASSGVPPVTEVQMVNQALAISLSPGDRVEVYPSTSIVKTVNVDGSIS